MVQGTNAARLSLSALLAGAACWGWALGGGASVSRADDAATAISDEARVEYPQAGKPFEQWVNRRVTAGRTTPAAVVAMFGKDYESQGQLGRDKVVQMTYGLREPSYILRFEFDGKSGRLTRTTLEWEHQTGYHIGSAVTGAP